MIIDESAISVAGLMSEIDELKTKLKKKQDLIDKWLDDYPGQYQ